MPSRHRRHHRRPAVRAGALVASLAWLLAAMAAPAAAKEGLVATLDAPIAFDSPPGEILLVGATVVALDGATGEWVPVIGTPVYLRLTGPDGDSTRAAAEGTRIDGYYTFHVEVPAGGPRRIEMGVHGSSSDGPMDLPMMMGEDPFTFGPIREGTAQLASVAEAVSAPPVAPAVPAATAAAAASAAPAPAAPVAVPGQGAPPAPDGLPAWVPVAIAAALVAAIAGAWVLAAGRSRRARRPDLPGTAGGG